MEHLNRQEFNTLICSLNRNKLTSWIFDKLLNQLKHQELVTDIDVINSKISEIIQSRSISDAEEKSVVQSLTLNNLPNVLFPQISAFLNFTGQLNFEKTNRAIFIGLRSCSLHMHSLCSFTFPKLIGYQAKNTTLIPRVLRVNSLSVDCDYLGHHEIEYDEDDDYDEWEESWTLSHDSIQLTFIRKIQSLMINSYNDVRLCAVLDSYIVNQSESFPNLKRLCITSDEFEVIRDIEPSLNALISRCSGLEYFEIDGMFWDEADFTEYEWVSNLKGIAAAACDEEDYRKISPLSVKLYSALSSKVESLHLVSLSIVNALNCNLSNLKELCLIDTPSAGVFGVNSYWFLLKQNMAKLKRLNYSCNAWKKQIGDSHVMVLWLKKMLKSVEYFCMEFEDTEILRIMKVVHSVVRDSTMTGRSLKLRFNHRATGKWSRREKKFIWKRFERINELFEGLEGLFGAFELRHFDWMFILHGLNVQKDRKAEVVASSNDLRKINGYLVDLKWKEYESQRSDRTVDIVIRGSQNHRIQEQWDMTCCNCLSQTVIFE